MAVLRALALAEPDKPEIQAVQAMRARGIDNPEQLLEFASPAAILGACRRWDGLAGVRPGLLAKWIREGGVEEAQPVSSERLEAEQHARFDEYRRRFVPGSVCETHATAELRRRRNHPVTRDLDPAERDDPSTLCGGGMVVIDGSNKVITARCDECGEELTYPLRALGVLPGRPLATDQPEPEPAHAKPDTVERRARFAMLERGEGKLRPLSFDDLLKKERD